MKGHRQLLARTPARISLWAWELPLAGLVSGSQAPELGFLKPRRTKEKTIACIRKSHLEVISVFVVEFWVSKPQKCDVPGTLWIPAEALLLLGAELL